MLKICSICETPKDISLFYKQPWGIYSIKKECKVCYKAKRRTEKYRSLDRNRYHNNSERNIKCKEHTKEWVKKNPKKRKAQNQVHHYFRNKSSINKPTECCMCWSKKRIHLHHEDYDFPEKVYPLCVICHANRHAWNIELDNSKEITLDFSNKRTKIFIEDNWILKTVKQLSEEFNIPKYLITQRYRKWFKFKDIIFKWNLQFKK